MRESKLLAIDLIKQFEGLSLKVYEDVGGLSTIGYGHRCAADYPKITEEKACCLIEDDLNDVFNQIARVVCIPLKENQLAALASFVFNLGIGRLFSSTMLKLINQNKLEEAGLEFLRWNKCQGKEILGLTRRRQKELELWKR